MRNLVAKPDPRERKARNVVLRFLNARVSFPSWMLALSSMGIAYIALFLLFFGPIGLGPFGAALPFSGYMWAPLITASTTATVVGLIWIRRVFLLKYGAFVSFMMWILGGFAFATSGQLITAIIVATPWALFYAYVYLASFFREETGI